MDARTNKRFKAQFFPNPTKNSIYLNFNQFNKHALTVYDVSGKKVFQERNLKQKNSLDFSKFTSGVYFFKIKEIDSHEVVNIKIIKQ